MKRFESFLHSTGLASQVSRRTKLRWLCAGIDAEQGRTIVEATLGRLRRTLPAAWLAQLSRDPTWIPQSGLARRWPTATSVSALPVCEGATLGGRVVAAVGTHVLVEQRGVASVLDLGQARGTLVDWDPALPLDAVPAQLGLF